MKLSLAFLFVHVGNTDIPQRHLESFLLNASLGIFRMQKCAKNYLNSGEIEDRIHITKRISFN